MEKFDIKLKVDEGSQGYVLLFDTPESLLAELKKVINSQTFEVIVKKGETQSRTEFHL